MLVDGRWFGAAQYSNKSGPESDVVLGAEKFVMKVAWSFFASVILVFYLLFYFMVRMAGLTN